jgi:hypothetical protein
MNAVGIQCVDENGATVDWLIIYKLPNTLFKSGNGIKPKNAKNRMALNKNKAQTNEAIAKKGLPWKGTTAKKGSNGANAEKPSNGTKKNLLQSGQV